MPNLTFILERFHSAHLVCVVFSLVAQSSALDLCCVDDYCSWKALRKEQTADWLKQGMRPKQQKLREPEHQNTTSSHASGRCRRAKIDVNDAPHFEVTRIEIEVQMPNFRWQKIKQSKQCFATQQAEMKSYSRSTGTVSACLSLNLVVERNLHVWLELFFWRWIFSEPSDRNSFSQRLVKRVFDPS